MNPESVFEYCQFNECNVLINPIILPLKSQLNNSTSNLNNLKDETFFCWLCKKNHVKTKFGCPTPKKYSPTDNIDMRSRSNTRDANVNKRSKSLRFVERFISPCFGSPRNNFNQGHQFSSSNLQLTFIVKNK